MGGLGPADFEGPFGSPMDAKLTLFAAVQKRMSWLAQRQEVLAQNIANADTPDYHPLDLKEGPFARLLAKRLSPVQPAATNPGHITAATAQARPFGDEEQEEVYEITPSGNAVVLEEQLVKVQETQMDYQTMVNLYRKHLQMIRTALGRGGN